MQKLSLPIILNEPMNMLQKCCEGAGNIDLLRNATAYMNVENNLDTSKDSCKRLVLCAFYGIL
jgi:hypothetical protein